MNYLISKKIVVAFAWLLTFPLLANAESANVPKARSPQAVIKNLETYFNAGDTVGIVSLFTDEAVFVNAPDGEPIKGRSSITSAMAGFVDLGVTLDANIRRVYQSDDIALVIVDWVLTGPDANGKPFDLSGTATDVVSRADDGTWHYRIDNAFGSQKAE